MNYPLNDYLQQQYSKATAAAYYRTIQDYLCNNESAAVYHYADIMRYIGVLRKRYTNIKTLTTITAAIKAYYGYLAAAGLRSDNPSKSIVLKDTISKDVQLQDLFTTAELEQLLEKKERYAMLQSRNKVLIGLLIYQALLPKEIAAVKVSDIDLMTATVFIAAQPKMNSRTLSLKPQQVMLLLQYIQQDRKVLLKDKEHDLLMVGSRGNVFTAEEITKYIQRSFSRLFYPRKLTPVTIRQSVISNLLQSHNLRAVQVFAGHKNPSTTEQYKPTDTAALKQQIQQYHPFK